MFYTGRGIRYSLLSTIFAINCSRGRSFAAPAVMALTITLPVVVTPLVTEKSVEPPAVMPGSLDSRLIDFEVERALIAEEEAVEELHELKYNKWLM